MATYVIRIYRFQKDNPRHLVGIVESVTCERREKRAFTNLDDLWEILNSETAPLRKKRAARKIKATPYPMDALMEGTMTVVDVRRLTKDKRVLLTGYAIKEAGKGEIVVLVDDDNAREDISRAASNQGWMLRGMESDGDNYRITITPISPS